MHLLWQQIKKITSTVFLVGSCRKQFGLVGDGRAPVHTGGMIAPWLKHSSQLQLQGQGVCPICESGLVVHGHGAIAFCTKSPAGCERPLSLLKTKKLLAAFEFKATAGMKSNIPIHRPDVVVLCHRHAKPPFQTLAIATTSMVHHGTVRGHVPLKTR